MDRKIGAQLYTVRDFCKTEADFGETLTKLQKIGYKRIQVSGVGPISAEAIRQAADASGMEITCTHRPLNEFFEDLPALIRFHQTMGCPIAGLGSMPRENCDSLDALRAFIDKINGVVAELKKNGLVFAYHNHAFEFSKLNGKWIMDYLLEETDPEGFCFIPDVYWMAYAGVNPADYIRKMGRRAKVVHFKDLQVAEWTKVTFAEVMAGNLDWDAIIAACDEAGVGCAMVEQDICPGNPFDSMQISYENLKTKGFC